MRTSSFVTIAIVLVLPWNVVRAGLLINGSFEDGTNPPNSANRYRTLQAGSSDLAGWSIIGVNVDWVSNFYLPAADGSFCIDLVGSDPPANPWGGVEQTFTTVIGQQYSLSFELSANENGPPVMKTAEVSIAGLIQDFSVGSPTWMPFTIQFAANSAQTTVAFTSLPEEAFGNAGPLLDSVSVVPIPEPGISAWIFVIAFVANPARPTIGHRVRAVPTSRVRSVAGPPTES